MQNQSGLSLYLLLEDKSAVQIFFCTMLFNIKNYRGSPWIWIKVLHPKLDFLTTRGMRKYLLHH